MAYLEKQLFVKKSTLPDAGKGLFTRKEIAKGERIVEYKGRRTTWKEVKDQHDNGYIFYINRNHVINALPYKKAWGRFANDARGIEKIKGFNNNAEYVIEGKKVFIEAKKKIPAGAEIFVDYGKDYWDVTKDNIDVEKKQKKQKKQNRKQTKRANKR